MSTDLTSELPRLLSAADLAAKLNLPLWRVYELAREGALPTIRLGRAVRFSASSVAAWLARGGTAPRV